MTNGLPSGHYYLDEISTITGFSTEPHSRSNITGVVDSNVVTPHLYYGPVRYGMQGWDPSGVLRNLGHRLTRVQGFVKITGAYNTFWIENQNVSGSITAHIGSPLHFDGSYGPPQQIGLKFFTGVDNPNLPPLSQNGTGLFGEAYALLGDAVVTVGPYDGTLDYAGTSGYIHTFTGSTPGYIPAFNTTDSGILTLCDSASFDIYVQQWYILLVSLSGNPCPDPLPSSVGNSQLLPAGGSSFFFRYFYV